MNSTLVGDTFEAKIYEFLNAEIEAGNFCAKKECCRIYPKKGYYSKDRESSIIFDIAIEIYLPGQDEFSMVWLIECKNYTSPVPVSDAEEFFAKTQQVAAARCKAVIASTAEFQAGVRAYSKSKGIGLMRYFEPSGVKWELLRSASASVGRAKSESIHQIDKGLSEPDHRSEVFDFYMQSPIRLTNSLWDFAEDTLLDGGMTLAALAQISNSRRRQTSQVPFIEKNEFEALAEDLIAEIGYTSNEVSLELISERERARCGLSVVTNLPLPDGENMLGRILFRENRIEIFSQLTAHRVRERFTLAHELAHHLLGHGKHLLRESCEERDLSLQHERAELGVDVSRMEYQANTFAACLLMPRRNFIFVFLEIANRLSINDKGFGPLFVDNQMCNIEAFQSVTTRLMLHFGVSRTAAKIRLENLGLLRDVREQPRIPGDALLTSIFAS